MLSVAHLLDALDHLDHFEKKVVQAGNQGMAGAGPTWTTWTTEKQGMHDETDGAERPLPFEPLPGRYFIDPVERGYLVTNKVMADLSECKGYPQACPRCRLSMVSGQCLLGPEGGDV